MVQVEKDGTSSEKEPEKRFHLKSAFRALFLMFCTKKKSEIKEKGKKSEARIDAIFSLTLSCPISKNMRL